MTKPESAVTNILNKGRVTVNNGLRRNMTDARPVVSKFMSRPEFQRQRQQWMTPTVTTNTLTDFSGVEFDATQFQL